MLSHFMHTHFCRCALFDSVCGARLSGYADVCTLAFKRRMRCLPACVSLSLYVCVLCLSVHACVLCLLHTSNWLNYAAFTFLVVSIAQSSHPCVASSRVLGAVCLSATAFGRVPPLFWPTEPKTDSSRFFNPTVVGWWWCSVSSMNCEPRHYSLHFRAMPFSRGLSSRPVKFSHLHFTWKYTFPILCRTELLGVYIPCVCNLFYSLCRLSLCLSLPISYSLSDTRDCILHA